MNAKYAKTSTMPAIIIYTQCASVVLGIRYSMMSDTNSCNTMYIVDTTTCGIFNSFAISWYACLR